MRKARSTGSTIRSPGNNFAHCTAFGLYPHLNLKAFRQDLKCTRKARSKRPSFFGVSQAVAPRENTDTSPTNQGHSTPTRVLILGGTGRAGAQTARALTYLAKNRTSITIAGRSEARGWRVVRDVRDSVRDYISQVQFEKVDIADENRLAHLIQAHDLIVHTAGPFQKRGAPNEVLRAAIKAGKDYIDICDDVAHAKDAKTLQEEAKRKNVRAIVCAGIYPGIGNMAAAEAVSRLPNRDPESIHFFYYTAGSGGAGATVLASTFLLLSQSATCFTKESGLVLRPAASDLQVIDFGGKVGKKTTYLLNLPEVSSLHETFLAPNGGGEVWAKFCTGPVFWNWLLQVMARFGPKDLMANREAMQKFARFSLPMVRFVDMFSGARTCFILKVTGKRDGYDAELDTVSVMYEHESLERSVGEATAAFVVEMIRDQKQDSREVKPGIHFPEELSGDVRRRICVDAVATADRYIVE